MSMEAECTAAEMRQARTLLKYRQLDISTSRTTHITTTDELRDRVDRYNNADFTTNAQQDVMEFINSLLDGLPEALSSYFTYMVITL